MICNLFVFRHAETTDNSKNIFSGWRDPDLTPRGLLQAQEVARQLEKEKINYAFTSHLMRAERTLEIVLKSHPKVPIFIDDRLIERCYGTLQGKSKIGIAAERPDWFAKVHRGYDFPPPEGESLKMVENRTLPFVVQLEGWLRQNPGNVAISCHSNSMRPIRRVFEHLSLKQMLRLENPQDQAMEYALHIHRVNVSDLEESRLEKDWYSVLVPSTVKFATDPRNPLKKYY
ncbi:histidine phosphatase family protein [Candidatus Bathyarchaeota archaeon]|nr:histidine phosphatase family protein [Candidatus Bathyarchaeota archaeon]